MAKSLFEPKKVPTYTENIIKPGAGLQSAPVPARQRTVSTGTPKLAQAQSPAPVAVPASPPAPSPTPAPAPAPAETRAFSFDGATELRAEFPGTGNAKYGTAMLTFTPYWSQEATGSFTLYTIGTSGSNDYRIETSIVRSSGSDGYLDQLSYKAISGSNTIQTLTTLASSPNTYSGSVARSFIQLQHNQMYMGRVSQGKSYLTTRSFVQSGGIVVIPEYTGSLHDISVGGLNSGSEHYFSGSIDQFVWINAKNFVNPRSSAQQYDNNPYVKAYYKFEGSVAAAKGNALTVVGTEAYVSSSI